MAPVVWRLSRRSAFLLFPVMKIAFMPGLILLSISTTVSFGSRFACKLSLMRPQSMVCQAAVSLCLGAPRISSVP